VALAGFSGIVVALEAQPVRSWTPMRRRDLRVLLQLSALALFFSLLPLLAYASIDDAGFWRWGLGAYGLVHVIDVSTFLFRQPGVARTPIWIGLVFAVAQIAVALLSTDSTAEVWYMLSVTFHLAGAAMGFVFLIWNEGAESAP
jgi:hypothetical protein